MVFALTCILNISASAQITAAAIEQFVNSKERISGSGIRFPSATKEFYSLINYQPAWLKQNDNAALATLLSLINQSSELGLKETDYHPDILQMCRNKALQLKNADDSLLTEICISDAAVHFLSDMVYGNNIPSFGYNGLKYTPACFNIPELLAKDILENKFPFLLTELVPAFEEINTIVSKIKWYHFVMAEKGFEEVTFISDKLSVPDKNLVRKLYQLGIIDSVDKILRGNIFKETIKAAQQQFDLPADGKINSALIQKLRVPLATRMQQLILSVNYYRWLYCLTRKQSTIVVNIPAAYMKVYEQGKKILEMRMIVGKKSTPTPTLTSTVNEVILYPYWHVPYKIATQELLPAIKRNPGYVNANNYQVLNSAGKAINPYSINWRGLSSSYFPYVIRQSTGCDNALGLLKLDFYNPFSVYLHDTPGKNLFKQTKRFYSHGCMRMEKPMELGHLALKNNTIAIDTLEEKGCLRNQSPVKVHATNHMPVIVWYNPAGTDVSGNLVFFGDIYGKFNW